MYQGLQLAVNLNFEELVCYSDSLLAFNLINGDTSLFHVYVVLIQDIKDLLNSRNYYIHHSLREGNHCADFMAKLGATTDVDLAVHVLFLFSFLFSFFILATKKNILVSLLRK